MNALLEKRNEVLFAKLVPGSGNCETLEGETLRAVNRLCYRWSNDGDYWYEGYGTETAGCAETFLRRHSPVNVTAELDASLSKREDAYEEALEAVVEKVLTYIEGRTTYTPNTLDMLKCKARFVNYDKYDYGDDYYD